MAKTAVREADETGEQKIDFQRAISIMRTDIKTSEKENAETRGDLAGSWKRVVDECNVEKNAAKVFRKNILEASEERRDDFLRSLYGLMKEAELGISQDLVDRMSDAANAPQMPIVGAKTYTPAPQNEKAAEPMRAAATSEDLETINDEMTGGNEQMLDAPQVEGVAQPTFSQQLKDAAMPVPSVNGLKPPKANLPAPAAEKAKAAPKKPAPRKLPTLRAVH